jgi:hypothetical protein
MTFVVTRRLCEVFCRRLDSLWPVRHSAIRIQTRAGALTNLLPRQGGLPTGDVAHNGKLADASSPFGQTRESIVTILANGSRRQLLISVATMTVAGIGRNVAHTEALAKSDIAQQTRASVSAFTESQERNLHPVTILRLREIAERNRIRQGAGLSLISIPRELRRMKEAADIERFRKFADAHRTRVHEKMLARTRRRCDDPHWAPTGVLSGGGVWFSAQVDAHMRELYQRLAGTRVRLRSITSDGESPNVERRNLVWKVGLEEFAANRLRDVVPIT